VLCESVELHLPLEYDAAMKKTVELDETRLKRVMRLTGLKSRKAALDYALPEAEQAARIRRFLKSLLPDAEYADSVAAGSDVLAVREKETPYRA
jgi:Arc/MetJ family transcription regulator